MMNKMQNILLVEDDPSIGGLVKEFMEIKNFVVTLATDGEKGFYEFQKSKFDLLLLDIMMPLKDGFTLAKEIRKLDGKIPIIFLTAKSLHVDKIEGFKIGADDYVTKPFSMEELLLRINAILKRVKGSSKKNAEINLGGFTYSYSKRELMKGKDRIKLTSKENELLNLLINKNGELLSRSEALLKIWKSDSYFNSRSMDVYISKLRGYFKMEKNVEIVNIHGEGFKIIY